jgi:hypothetical protein
MAASTIVEAAQVGDCDHSGGTKPAFLAILAARFNPAAS